MAIGEDCETAVLLSWSQLEATGRTVCSYPKIWPALLGTRVNIEDWMCSGSARVSYSFISFPTAVVFRGEACSKVTM